jgi:hypothetical protein
MDILPNEILARILDYVHDIDKLCFMLTSTTHYKLFALIKIHMIVGASSIYNHRYRNSFLSVLASDNDMHWIHELPNIIELEVDCKLITRLPKLNDSIKIVTLIGVFDPDLKGRLPAHSTHVNLGQYFKNPTIGSIPDTVTHLILGSISNDRIVGLPDSITHLTTGDKYNSVLLDCLPKNCTHLIFGRDYNHPLSGLPPGLKVLSLGASFNFSLKNVLPVGLEVLHLGSKFNQKLLDLPPGLKELQLGMSYTQPIVDADISYLPNSIIILRFGCCFNKSISRGLPPNLEHVSFGILFNQPINEVNFPSTLRYLHFGDSFNQPIYTLPSLKHLRLGMGFNEEIHCKLPDTITNLILKSPFEFNLNGGLPESLMTLTVTCPSEQITTNLHRCKHLIDLTIEGTFDSTIFEYIPPTVTTLMLGNELNFEITKDMIPHINKLILPLKYEFDTSPLHERTQVWNYN